ncbi:hypothetical protein HYZ06_00455 [Candidatus Daviesbacteria bacterium]|nr:hypothetical protein [Candidatus Daviesbacteria bacterium]
MVGAEELSRKIEERARQQEAAGVAFRKCQQEILGAEITTSDRAMDLGGQFLARLHEYQLFSEDRAHLQNETGGLNIVNPHQRGGLEKAFFDAQKGDYRGFKEALFLSSQQSWVREGLKEKLAKIAHLIPDQGEPFRPPLPAWQDPEFTQLESSTGNPNKSDV